MYHRAWQFFSAAFARVRPSERVLVERHLSPAQMALFWHMARCDQRHALDVLQTLRQAGHHDETLLQAALLHDVGKAAGRLTIWHRLRLWLSRPSRMTTSRPQARQERMDLQSKVSIFNQNSGGSSTAARTVS